MGKTLRSQLVLFFILVTNLIFAQAGSYYDAVSTSSPSFINDLKSRVRSPYTKISYDNYDETNVKNFASRDTTGGQKVVTCVYSGENYVYTPPFAWGRFSREHTWCHSWMPTYSSESGNEYSDQHHLFPTNQNDANGPRSNHPLGNVASASKTYLEGKLGTNSKGQTVYEPRNAQKGDAARALLYMCIKYDGVNGTWNFKWLNETRLPSISEAPEDLQTLLEWNRQDPPDKWEVDRNNYIQSVQQNRNPFVDHPEYINYINFYDLSPLSPSFASEPANQVTNFSASASGNSVTVSWTDAAQGTQTPSGYLLLAYSKDNYIIPMDGASYSDDPNLSDGVAMINIPYSAADSYTFTNLPSSDYYFTIYSYNGTGTQINYKTDGGLIRTNTKASGSTSTKVFFTLANASVSEGSGTYSLNLGITDPSATAPTTVQVALTSGSNADINNYAAQTVTFPAGSSAPQTVQLTITDDAIVEGNETLTFTLQNASGGNAVQIGTPGTFNLTIQDNDGSPVTGGTEDFANFPETSNSYKDGSFTGKDGSVWTYTLCAGTGSPQITAPSPVLKKDATAQMQSGTISGGCATISFKYMQTFDSNVNLGLYINNNLVYTATSSGEKTIVKSTGSIPVNVSGSFVIKLKQLTGSSGQVTIDDITWTGLAGGDGYPLINSVSAPSSSNLPLETNDYAVTANITDDHAVSSAKIIYKIDGGANQEASMTNSGSTYSGNIPNTAYTDGSLVEYWVRAQDDAAQVTESSHKSFLAGITPLSTLHAQDANGVLIYSGLYAHVSGVATASNGIFSTSNLDTYIQDATGGINLFKSGAASTAINAGNKYTVTGVIAQYNGKAEITPNAVATDITDNGAGTMPDPIVLTLTQLLANPEAYECRLVGIQHVTKQSGTWPPSAAFANITITDDVTHTLTLRINNVTGGASEPAFPKDIVGILGQFAAASPYNSGYQLMTRSSADYLSNGSLPVELTDFKAVLTGSDVKLLWNTATEVNNYGFEVERNGDGTWSKIGFVQGAGNSNSPKNYSFIDNNPKEGKYLYRLKQIDNDGKFEYSPVVEIEVHKGSPEKFTCQNHPNPFNNSTKIVYTLPSESKVKLTVYNSIGEVIAELVNSTVPAGSYSVDFNANNLASGIYFCVIEAESLDNGSSMRATNKMLFLK